MPEDTGRKKGTDGSCVIALSRLTCGDMVVMAQLLSAWGSFVVGAHMLAFGGDRKGTDLQLARSGQARNKR